MERVYWIMEDVDGNVLVPLGDYTHEQIRMFKWVAEYRMGYTVEVNIASWPNKTIMRKKEES